MPMGQEVTCGSTSASSLALLPGTVPESAPAPRRGQDQEQEYPGEAGGADPAVAAAISALGQEFGDETPRSSVTRAHGIMSRAGLSAPEFLAVLREAMARTRRYRAQVRTRRGSDGTPNLVPYTFAVLESLLSPAPESRRPCGGGGRRRYRLAPLAPLLSAAAAPALPDEPHPVWRAVLEELRAIMTPVNFTRWFAPTCALAQDGDLLRIAVPNEFHRAWLDTRLRHQVEGTLGMIDHTGLRVAFVATV